jgi:hypothetical protein
MAEFILDTRLSEAHYVICKEAIARGVIEAWHLNEGRRTLAEQTAFWVHFKRFGKPLAAFPSPNAPHIVVGHANHAIDCEQVKVNELANFYRSMGVPCILNTVVGEPWHMVFPDEGALLRAADSLRSRGGRLVTLKPGRRHADVRTLRFRLWDAGVKGVTASSNRKFYGPLLVRKVKQFQRKHGLRADGVVGQRTWNKLKDKGGRR